MNENQIISHLEDLKTEAEGHFTDDGDQDTEALQAAIDAVKRNEIIADAINSEIANCNREIRKVDIEELYREADKWAEEESNDNTRSKSVP